MVPGLEHRHTLQQTQARRRLLVVDDEQVICQLCSDALSDYQVSKASSGEEALRLLDQQPIDLILTDVLMPGMDGIELLQRVKRTTPELPVLVMTGFTDRETVVRALQAGADDFIDKPVNLLDLCTTVNRALERKELEDQVRRLRHLDRLHTQFLGLISHKLKTPVTAISLILQNLAQEVDPEGRQALGMALQEADHLGHLIEDLLFFSDTVLEAAPPNPEPVDLIVLQNQVVAALRSQAAAREIQLEPGAEIEVPPITADRERLRFALRAVLENAIKFSPDGGTVTLSARLHDGCLELRVRDRGPGIPPAEQARVFDRFYQIDPASTGQVRGFGLGLYYAREFVRGQGGELQLLSCEGEGTTVLLRFPLPGEA